MMDAHADNQAMTEVSLGLAMAFFAIMIVALVSMSVKHPSAQPVSEGEREGQLEGALKITAIASSVQSNLGKGSSNGISNNISKTSNKNQGIKPIETNDFYIVFYQGKYLDTQMRQISPQSLPFAERYVLAMEPALSFQQVMSVRTEIPAANVVITALNASWLKRLKSS